MINKTIQYLSLFKISFLLLFLSACGGGDSNATDTLPDPTIIEVTSNVQLAEPKRLGINLGSYAPYADAGMMKSVITNPGFEAGEIAVIFIAEAAGDPNRVKADHWETQWNRDDLNIGQPVDFWNGAEYEVLYGNAKGRSGTITDFSHLDNRYLFFLSGEGPAIQDGDAVLVRQQLPGYEGDTNTFNRADTSTTRPGSPGQQSLRLLPANANWQASFDYYMDSFWRDADPTAGKLMPVEGEWQVGIWAKAETPGNTLNMQLRREGETTFFSQTVTLSEAWQYFEFNFTVLPGVDKMNTAENRRNILNFHLKIPTDKGQVWVDDVRLTRLGQQNPTVFSDVTVEQLNTLQPGILRDWGSQLGSSLDNQLAEPWARRTTASSPRSRQAKSFHYSLPEFLQLAQHIGAEPWYVIPPTWSAAELENLVAFLAAPAGSHPYADKRAALGQITPWTTVFNTIHLEYGNEMWGSNAGNDPFRGATLRGGVRLGSVAHDRFTLLKRSPFFQADQFSLIIGGQSQAAMRQGEIERNSQAHTHIAIAPYFGELEQYATEEERYYPLFARSLADVQPGGRVAGSMAEIAPLEQGTQLAIYEINFHTSRGEMPLDIRNDFVTGLNGGLALPLYMLNYQKFMGITQQAAFQFLQYSFKMSDGDYVRLWGVLRDLEATGRKRPTGLGLELANQAIQGELLETVHQGSNPKWTQPAMNDVPHTVELPFVHSFAFRAGDSYRLLLFNVHLYESQTVELRLPTAVQSHATLKTLSSGSIHDDNEDGELIRLTQRDLTRFQDGYSMSLAPHAMYLLTWEAAL